MQCNQKCQAKPGQTLIDLALSANCNVWKLKKVNKLEHCHLLPNQEVMLTYDNKHILQRDLLKSVNITIPILYLWEREHIQGALQICYDYLIFTANTKKLTKDQKGKEDHLNFSILVREIYKIIFNPIAELMQVFVWGICGTKIPNQGNQKMLLVELKVIKGETKVVKTFVRELWQMKGKSKRMVTMEAFTYLIQLLQQEHESVIGDSLNVRVKKGETNIECSSSVYNFNYVEINEKNGTMEICKFKQQQAKEIVEIKLNEESRIISLKQVKEISEGMAQYYQHKPWYLLYSVNRHGSSFQEFLRRTEYAGPHVIIIKDHNKRVFGAFLLESWRLSKNEFFGKGESYLFVCLYNHTRLYKSSQKNTCYQMADETGFSVGAGDKYGLFVSSTFRKGESNPCETFDNETLSSETNFTIQELEVWGLDEEAILQLKFQDKKRSLFSK